MGKSYVEIKDVENSETQPFEVLFKANDVAYYKIDTVKEKEPGGELEILPKELTRGEVLLATALTFLILW